MESKNLEKRFLDYASGKGVVPKPEDWKLSGDILITQLKALVGRYSPLDDKAYYPIISKIDNVIQAASR